MARAGRGFDNYGAGQVRYLVSSTNKFRTPQDKPASRPASSGINATRWPCFGSKSFRLSSSHSRQAWPCAPPAPSTRLACSMSPAWLSYRRRRIRSVAACASARAPSPSEGCHSLVGEPGLPPHERAPPRACSAHARPLIHHRRQEHPVAPPAGLPLCLKRSSQRCVLGLCLVPCCRFPQLGVGGELLVLGRRRRAQKALAPR